MHRTRIKFCGMTRPEDAAAAAKAGADAIGMVFHAASTRNISIERAKEILAALPPFVTPVGLFVDSTVEEIQRIAGQLGLRHVQLQGNEPPSAIASLKHLAVIKAVHVRPQDLVQTLTDWRNVIAEFSLSNLRGLLLETHTPAGPGGTGIENDWIAIAAAKKSGAFAGLPEIIVAGGLNPMNVASVVRELQPWAVDVSSGIESSRGIKSIEKMEQFAAAVRDADCSRDVE